MSQTLEHKAITSDHKRKRTITIECTARREEGICGKRFPKKYAKYLGPTAYCPSCYQRWKDFDD